METGFSLTFFRLAAILSQAACNPFLIKL